MKATVKYHIPLRGMKAMEGISQVLNFSTSISQGLVSEASVAQIFIPV